MPMRPSAFQMPKGLLVQDSASGFHLAFQTRHEIGLAQCNSGHVGTRGYPLEQPTRISNPSRLKGALRRNPLNFKF
jgi:hypothetical protein